MISKGTTHNNGAKLAAYMTTGKDQERAELWELRGFGATNIKDAFRDVQIMAGATKCSQPFFHVQVRNREGETLSRPQWQYTADRIEQMLGLAGQSRAIAFHLDEKAGQEHMHVAWSRIDEDALTAKPLPFFKRRLKKISRELELHFALEPVTNHREGKIGFAPTRSEEEQARRLGLNIHDLRNTLRNCYERSDCGISFQAALELEDFILAQGERRDYVVIDKAGGLHSLGKRILDVSAAKIRDRLSDLSREDLPTVEMARAHLQQLGREKQPKQGKSEPAWDRDRADQAWQDAVIKAAIEKEKVERQFVEPKQTGAGGRKKKSGIEPPLPAWTNAYPQVQFEGAARQTTGNRNTPPKELSWMDRKLMKLFVRYRRDPASLETDVKTFAAALDDKGIALAKMTKEEAERSQREAKLAKSLGKPAQHYKEGEIVAVTEAPLEYRRKGQIIEPRPRVHKLDQSAAAMFVTALDKPSELKGIDATKQALDERAQKRTDQWNAIRLENATKTKKLPSVKKLRSVLVYKTKRTAARSVAVGMTAARTAGSILDALCDVVESVLAPKPTPERTRMPEKATQQRAAETESVIDSSRHTAEMAQQRQQQEQLSEAARQRERDGRER